MFYLILSMKIVENEESASLCTVSGINYWFTYLLNGLTYLSMLLKSESGTYEIMSSVVVNIVCCI